MASGGIAGPWKSTILLELMEGAEGLLYLRGSLGYIYRRLGIRI